MRLLSYNVRSLRDDGAAVARVIRAARPDVVAIQEAPRFLRWRTLCAQLARRGGLVVVGGGRDAGANLILSSLGVDVESHVEVFFSRDPRLHHRGAAIAVLRKGETRFAVAGTHLDLVEAPRLRHIRELEDAIERHVPADVPVIVAGDVNDRPGSRAWAALCERRVDALATAGSGNVLTSTARHPHQTIDGVFVDARIRILSARVLEHPDVTLASDHRPVVVELEL
jgi:endonuclease/exonuclease/phosphatase family metal-dependent hydrolase